MLPRSLLLAQLALGLLSVPAAAQLPAPEPIPIPFGCTPPDLSLYKIGWSSPTSSGAFGRTIVGNFDSDGGPDLVTRRGFSASMQSNIATEEGSVDLPANVTDMACLPGLGQFGGDAIAVVNGSGLRVLSYDPASQTFTNSLLTSSWAGARQIVATDFDGDGRCDLFGLSNDYTTILRLQQVSTGVFVPATPFTLGGTPIRLLRTIEWDGDSRAELALITQYEWGVWEVDGTAVNTIAKPYLAGDTLTALHDPSSTDRLAYCCRLDVESNVVSLSVLRPGGQLDAPVSLGSCRAVTLAAADLRKTGYDDLVANGISEFKVLRLQNQRDVDHPSAPDFSPLVMEIDTVDIGSLQPSLCMPAAADFDVDGQIDFACAFEAPGTYVPGQPGGTYTLVKLSSMPRPLGSCAPSPVLTANYFRQTDFVEESMVEFLVTGICPPSPPTYGTRLLLRVSANTYGLTGMPASLTGKLVDVVLYRQPATNGVPQAIESPSLLHVRYTIDTDDQVRVVELDAEHYDLLIEVPWNESSDQILLNCYFFQVRLLPPDAQPGVYPIFMGSFAGFTSPPGVVVNTNPHYLANLPGALYGIVVTPPMISDVCVPQGSGTNQRLGGMAPQTRMPKLPSGLPPQQAPISPAGSIGVEGNLAESLLPHLPVQ